MAEFDVIIIGSGLGGLVTGAILGREGYRVCILEKNHTIGGSLQTFVRDGVKFDVGVHYFGGFDKGQNLYQLFKYFDLHENLKVERLDENGFDRITFRGDPNEYRLAQGHDNFVDKLLEHFPREKRALQLYVEKLKSTCDYFPLYNLANHRKKVFGADFEELSVRDVIASVTDNEKLRNVLAATNPLYAGEAEKTPFYIHALITNSYIQSAWRCLGGGSQIATHLMKQVKKQNGTVRLNSTVRKLVIEKGLVRAVELENGDQIEGAKFISNVHPAVTMDMIAPGQIRKAYRSRLAELENSSSAFATNIVLKKGFLKFWNYNRYHYTGEDVWRCTRTGLEAWPGCTVIFMSSDRDPGGFAMGISLLASMDYGDVARWGHTYNTVSSPGDRGEDYRDFKQRHAAKLIGMAEEVIPGLQENILSYSSSTPLTFRDYLGTKDGAIYGIIKDCRNPLKTYVAPRTKISNLFLAGQNLELHGLLGVTISSVLVCSEFTGSPSLINKILTH